MRCDRAFSQWALAWMLVMPMAITGGAIAAQPNVPQHSAEQSVDGQKPEDVALHEANRLYQQGEEQLNQGQLPDALESLQKALVIYREIRERKREGHTLRLIGATYFSQKDYAKMLDSQQESLSIARAIQDSDLEARALSNIGLAYASLLQSDRAQFYYKQSLVISTTSRNFRMIAFATSNLSNLLNDEKDYTQSRSTLQDALNFLPESIYKARVLWKLGSTYTVEAIGDPDSLTLGQIQDSHTASSQLHMLHIRAIDFYQQALKNLQFNPEPQLQGEILLSLANAYMNTNNLSRSIECSTQALLSFKKSLNRPKQLEALLSLMRYYSLMGTPAKDSREYQKGLDLSKSILVLMPEALNLAKVLNDSVAEKQILHLQVSAYFQSTDFYLELQDLSSAKESAEYAWILAKKLDSPKTETLALSALQNYYSQVGDYSNLFKVRERELKIARSNSNPYEISNALISLVSSNTLWEGHQDALKLLQEAEIKATEITSENRPRYTTDESVISLKHDIAMVFTTFYKGHGDHSQELTFAQRALAWSRQLSDRTQEIKALLRVASAHWSRQDYSSANQITLQALALAKTLNQSKLKIEALINLSQITADQGSPQIALEYAQQALNDIQRYKPQSLNYDWIELEQSALEQLSDAYRSQGDYNSALKALQQSTTVSEQTANPLHQQGARLSLGVFYLNLGDYTKATVQFQQALELAQTQQYPLHQQAALSFLSQVAFAQQKPQEAIRLAQQGLDISRRIQYPIGELSNLEALSRGYGELGDDAKAMTMAQATLDLARKTGNIGYERSALETLGNLHRRFGRWDQALASYESALASGGKYATTYAGLAQVYAHRRQPTVAIAFYKQAINKFENHRRNLRGLSTDLQQAYLQSTFDFGGIKNADIYRQLADLLISQGRILEAQEVLELLKAQELKDFNLSTRAKISNGEVKLDPTEQIIVGKYTTFIEFGQKLRDCQATKPQCAEYDNLTKLRKAANAEYTQIVASFEAAIKEREEKDKKNFLDPNNALNRKAQEIIVAQPNTPTAIIYSLVTDDKLWLVLVTKGEALRSFEIKLPQSQLNDTVRKFRSLLEQCETRPCTNADTAAFKVVSQQLHGLLFPAKLQQELQRGHIKHLVFAQDRITRYIPMAALFDGNQYLIEKYAVSTIVSASFTYDSPPPKRQDLSVLAAGLSTAVPPKFYALENVPQELNAIVRSGNTGIFPGLQLLNQPFDFLGLQKKLHGHNILHIATHGEFVRSQANASYILLGNGKPLSIPEILQLSDLGNLYLVVLSACQTALADRGADGIEISNVSYSFLEKGVKAVLASLWKVNDASTSLLMQQFYKHLATGTMTKTEALRQAQLQFLRGHLTAKDAPPRANLVAVSGSGDRATNATTTYAHPYYWAPFILIGNSL
jgi:CHAT domain-containing protein/Tfp pilus assembly protein PilF